MPGIYAQVINLVPRGLNWKTLLAFLDDVLIMGKSFDDHLKNLNAALKRFWKFCLKLKPIKYIISMKKIVGTTLDLSTKATFSLDKYQLKNMG